MRDEQRERLIGCAEAAIAARGLAGLRARDLAGCAGCSVGAIYNLVSDLDELVLLVGQRTMAQLDAAIAEVEDGGDVREQLIAWARAYAAFAIAHRERWRALFDFRMASGRDLPDWFAADQTRVFARLEASLATLLPELAADALRARARALFAAVHGLVRLGIDEKLVGLPPGAIDVELDAFVTTYVEGLCARVERGEAQGLSGSHASVSSR